MSKKLIIISPIAAVIIGLTIGYCLFYPNNNLFSQEKQKISTVNNQNLSRYIIYSSESKTPILAAEGSERKDIFLLDTWTGQSWRYQTDMELAQISVELSKVLDDKRIGEELGKKASNFIFSGRWISIPFNVPNQYMGLGQTK